MLIKFIYQIFSVLNAFLHDFIKVSADEDSRSFPLKIYFALNAKLLVFVLICAVIHSADCARSSR